MTYRYLKPIIMILLTIILVSCKEEFLDIKPKAAAVSGVFYQSMQDAEQAVTVAYSEFNNIASYDRNLLMCFGDVPSDDAEAGGEYVNEVPEIENYNRLNPDPLSGVLSNTFSAMYRAIYLSNLAMEKLPGIKSSDPNADPARLDKYIAECKFLRALNYSYLVELFGKVQLVDHTLGQSEYQMAKSDIKAVYDLIEKDLKEAIPVLPERSQWGGSNYGRASKGAAKALLAKVYLFESSYAKNYAGDERFKDLKERWSESFDYAEQVINSGEYKLVGIDGEKYPTWREPESNGYRYIFTSNGNNSKEGVFEIQCIKDGLGWNQARGSSYTNWTAARRYYDATGVAKNTGYWGLNLPNQSLVDEFEKGDPRFSTTIAVPGDSIEIRKTAGKRRFLMSFDKCVTGYYCRKYEASAAEYQEMGGPWHSSPINVHLIRYAEVYLIAAEAAIMLGNNDKALQYINMVRTRARNCGNTGIPADLTGNVTLDNIIHERRVEFGMEGHRYFDLVRWKLGPKYLNNATTTDGYPLSYESPKHDFFPFPIKELSRSGGMLEQNPGW